MFRQIKYIWKLLFDKSFINSLDLVNSISKSGIVCDRIGREYPSGDMFFCDVRFVSKNADAIFDISHSLDCDLDKIKESLK